MSKKIIVLVGISGSGKSSYAASLVQNNPQEFVLVNRDKIRELLFGYTEESISGYYQRKDLSVLEKQVTLYEDTLIHEGLNLDKTVVVDATHLEKRYLERYKFWNVPVEYKYFNITLNLAIGRDSERTRKVGAEVITRQFDKFFKLERVEDFEPVAFINDEALPPCIIYDIDGTIARKGGRNAFDWKAVGEDSAEHNVIFTMDIIKAVENKYKPKIIICTGRDSVCIKETLMWLVANSVPFEGIKFRPEKDQRPDWVVKEEMWREIAKEHYIVGMYDDRNQVTRRARALGLKVFQVEYGNF
jgi:predicted kinase